MISEDLSAEVTLTLKLEGEESATQRKGKEGTEGAKGLRHDHMLDMLTRPVGLQCTIMNPLGLHGMSLDFILRIMGRQV